MEVPWYWAVPWRVCRGTGAMAPPGAQRVGSQPSGVGPRDEKEYDVGSMGSSGVEGAEAGLSIEYCAVIIGGEMYAPT